LAAVDETDRAAEAGGAVRRRDAGEFLQELPAVVGVARVGAGVARRVDARPAAERVDLETRVVGEADRSGALGVPERLLARVLGEGRPLLGRGRDLGMEVEPEQVDAGAELRAKDA